MKKVLNLLFTFLAFSYLQGNNINWSSHPTIISGVTASAVDPVLAMDANGNSVAAWIENNYVKSSTHTPNGNWTPETIVSGPNASSPSLVSDLNGNSTLIWISNGVIYASTKALNDSWGTPKALSKTGATSPTLGVDDAGDVVAAWVRGENIEVTTKRYEQDWQRPVSIASTSAQAPHIFIGGSNSNTRAVLAWQGSLDGTKVIFTSTKKIPGNWTPQTLLSDAAHHASNPQVAVDSKGNAIAVWYEYDITGFSYTNVTFKSSESRSPKNTWNNITALSEPGISNPKFLNAYIAFDGIGNALAVWNISFDDQTYNIQSAVKPVNGQWSTAQDIIQPNLFAFDESISVSTFGDVQALFMYYNGIDLMIQSLHSNIDGYLNNIWSVPLTLSQGTKNGFPKIVSTISGNTIYATAIWCNNDTNKTILAQTGSKSLVVPPTSLNVTQTPNMFGVFTEYSNELSWNASTDPKVVNYLIFRNGLFIDQVDANVSTYTDRNRTRNGSVVYSVAAMDSQQNQSVAVSTTFP